MLRVSIEIHDDNERTKFFEFIKNLGVKPFDHWNKRVGAVMYVEEEDSNLIRLCLTKKYIWSIDSRHEHLCVRINKEIEYV